MYRATEHDSKPDLKKEVCFEQASTVRLKSKAKA